MYTDGPSYGGQVGAADLCRHRNREPPVEVDRLRYCLDPEAEYTAENADCVSRPKQQNTAPASPRYALARQPISIDVALALGACRRCSRGFGVSEIGSACLRFECNVSIGAMRFGPKLTPEEKGKRKNLNIN